ncbi:glutathione S-transferase N-terminal domain-containing protein [Faunimonas sp. B44]|uniref:glutathione S-transferase N-terminal domain-containing protein n=1 Tax=Faunimonas sp. B44 TaxID=3461493 RepID=UPI0040449BEF
MTVRLYELCGADRSLLFSPYCWRVRFALAHKGVAHETVPTAFTEVGTIGDGAFRSVPVLEEDGHLIAESFDIALHLEAEHPDRPALFENAAAVAAARFVEGWSMFQLHPAIAPMIISRIHDLLAPADQAYFRSSREARYRTTLEAFTTGVDANRESFAKALATVRHALARHEWLGGAEPRYADHVVLGSLMWLYTIHGELPLAADDPVLSWFGRGLDLYGGIGRAAVTAPRG